MKRVILPEEIREANEAIDAYSARLLEEGHPDSLDGYEQVFEGDRLSKRRLNWANSKASYLR